MEANKKKRNIIIIHNFYELELIEDVKVKIESDILKSFPIQLNNIEYFKYIEEYDLKNSN